MYFAGIPKVQRAIGPNVTESDLRRYHESRGILPQPHSTVRIELTNVIVVVILILILV